MKTDKFELIYSNNIIEHLGVKLYQNKPTNVFVEYISNSWDAAASVVNIKTDFENLTHKSIMFFDNGCGMSQESLANDFLVIGKKKREGKGYVKPARGETGRKGIGKLAGFGIAQRIHVLTVSDKGNSHFTWLEFDFNDIKNNTNTSYIPKIIHNESISNVSEFEFQANQKNIYSFYQENLVKFKVKHGTLICLENLTLKNTPSQIQLKKSIGTRLSSAVSNKSFEILLNTVKIEAIDVYPKFQNYNLDGTFENPKAILFQNKHEVKYWFRYIELESTNTSIENSGIGIYANGKLAQERPFFFGVKGKEIFSRYLYGVIEANWIDEQQDDLISTDRTSISWDNELLSDFNNFGAELLNKSFNQYKNWKNSTRKIEIDEHIKTNFSDTLFTKIEHDSLVTLLSELFTDTDLDDKNKNDVISTVHDAWIHAPVRKLTKDLWASVFKINDEQSPDFINLLKKLKDCAVPEMLSLSVDIAQKIAVITQFSLLIEKGAIEKNLQKLIEQFPWIIDKNWNLLTADQSIKRLVELKTTETANPDTPTDGSDPLLKRPDFVYLSNEVDNAYYVVEIKGSESERTLNVKEYRQLSNYLNIIQDLKPNAKIIGLLIGHDFGGFKESDNRISIKIWSDVLKNVRFDYVTYLAKLLEISNPSPNNSRVKQIQDFGGQETIELVKKFMQNHPDSFTTEMSEIFN